MRTATRRLLLPLAAAALVLGVAAACNYEPLTGNLTLAVSGIPADADHLDVLITDSAALTYNRHPSFGTGQYEGRSLDLTVKLDNPGLVTLQITALNHDESPVAGKSETGTFDGTSTLALATTLQTTGLDGTYGRPCLTAGTACGGTNVCKKYTGNDKGVCTLSCTSCGANPPGAVCEQFPVGGGNFCQWECGQADGGSGACPPGLVCGAALSGKRYCQGSN